MQSFFCNNKVRLYGTCATKASKNDNLFARPKSDRLVNCWLEVSDSMWVVNESSIHELLIILLVEELTTNHQPHTRNHVVLNQTSDRRAIFWHQVLEVSTGYK